MEWFKSERDPLAGQLKMGLWSFKQHLRSFSGWPFVDGWRRCFCNGQSAASFVSIFLKGIWPIITTSSSYSSAHSVASRWISGWTWTSIYLLVLRDKGYILPTGQFGDVRLHYTEKYVSLTNIQDGSIAKVFCPEN